MKYELNNTSTIPNWLSWILRRKIDVNIISGMVNNHQIKIIDISRQGLTGIWLRSTLVKIDRDIVRGHHLGSFVGGARFTPIQNLDDIIKKETGIV